MICTVMINFTPIHQPNPPRGGEQHRQAKSVQSQFKNEKKSHSPSPFSFTPFCFFTNPTRLLSCGQETPSRRTVPQNDQISYNVYSLPIPAFCGVGIPQKNGENINCFRDHSERLVNFFLFFVLWSSKQHIWTGINMESINHFLKTYWQKNSTRKLLA